MMKFNYTIKMMLIAIFAIISFKATSQDAFSFADDFESYDVGAYLAQSSDAWTTWSGNEGGQEDTKITDVKASSGTKSVYLLAGSAEGGPTDLVYKAPQLYDLGKVNIEMNLFVDEGNGAYFNLQGDKDLGKIWTLNLFFVDNGSFIVTDNNSKRIVIVDTYPTNEWFHISIEADLTFNNWIVKINNEVKGQFYSVVNKIASLDFFPVNGSNVGGNGKSSYYLDDFKFEYEPFVPLQKDATLSNLDILQIGLANFTSPIKGEVFNVGVDTIHNFEINWTYGTAQGSEKITDVNIPLLGKYSFVLKDSFLLQTDTLPFTMEISKINDTIDDNTENNLKSVIVYSVTPAQNKLFIGEELTGTWCGWCPRGAVALDYMSKKYPGFFQGLAIHGGDPMENKPYLTSINGVVNFTGYPGLAAMREKVMDPAAVESSFLENIRIAPAASMLIGAKFDEDTRNLKLSVTTKFLNENSNKYRVSVVMIENGITGTSSSYAQKNYYSYQSRNIPLVGAGHDWQAEPNPVPASKMVYNHVVRGSLNGFKGFELDDSHADGDEEIKNFSYTIPQEYDINNIEFVAILSNSDGTIDNGSVVTFKEALDNGFVQVGEALNYHDVVINEFVAKNDSAGGVADPAGEYDDWIEMYNNTDREINLSGMFLSDKFSKPQAWKFPKGTTIAAKSYLIVWADNDVDQEGIHATFKLKSSGEQLIFTNIDGSIIDSLTFGTQKTNVAMARVPNGTGDFVKQQPTFNESNNGVGTKDIGDYGINIYPNPAKNYLNIEFENTPEKNTYVEIFNTQGKKVFTQKCNLNSNQLNLAKLSTGVYTIRIITDSKAITSTKLSIIR